MAYRIKYPCILHVQEFPAHTMQHKLMTSSSHHLLFTCFPTDRDVSGDGDDFGEWPVGDFGDPEN